MSGLILVLIVVAIVWNWVSSSKSDADSAPKLPATPPTPASQTTLIVHTYTATSNSYQKAWRDPDHAKVSQAIDDGEDVTFDYCDLKGQRSRRRITPERMFRADGLYVEGYCHLRRADRTFKLDRMSAVKVVSH